MNKRLVEATKEKGTKARIRLISAGQGSSGYYSPELLETFGSLTFPVGTKIYTNHLMADVEWNNAGNHDVKDLIGVTTTMAEYSATDEALYADVKFLPHASEFVTSVWEDTDLSIEVYNFDEDAQGNVTYLGPHKLNCIALVPVGGRDGKIVQLIESFRNSKENKVNLEEMSSKLQAAISEGFKNLEVPNFSELTETMKEIREGLKTLAEGASSKDSETEGEQGEFDFEKAAEALVSSGLTKASRKSVYEKLKGGMSIEDAITEAKKLEEDLTTQLKENVTAEYSKSENSDSMPTIKGWRS